jgi:hypothetical protein
MKVVPLADQSGTIPLRASKNPVLGVYRHHCGDIATIHQPKGKKAHLRYILCDKCGCDQASGESYQEKIKANSFNSIEELESSEGKVIGEVVAVESVASDLSDKLTVKVTEKALITTEPETAPDIVVTVKKALPELLNEKTEQVTVKVTEPLTEVAQKNNEQIAPPNITRIGIAALIGGLVGGLLAFAR